MARTKQHPHIGKFVAFQEVSDPADRPPVFDTPEDALEAQRAQAERADWIDDGPVVYVYAIVGVKQIRKPTLTENLVEDLS